MGGGGGRISEKNNRFFFLDKTNFLFQGSLFSITMTRDSTTEIYGDGHLKKAIEVGSRCHHFRGAPGPGTPQQNASLS